MRSASERTGRTVRRWRDDDARSGDDETDGAKRIRRGDDARRGARRLRELGRGLSGVVALGVGLALNLGSCAESASPDPGGKNPANGGRSGGDGVAGAAGSPPFSIDLSCGNFELDPGEECDDGNQEDDDGCSSRCEREVRGVGDVCPGEAIELTPKSERVWSGDFSGDTSSRYHQYFGSCGGSGAEQIFALVPPIEGQLTWRVRAEHDALVYVRSSCEDETSETVCLDEGAIGRDETLVTYVRRGEPLYLFVDGLGKTEGPFEIEALLEAVECGNGVLEPSEACDDGNLLPGDGCDDRCRLESPSFAACPGAGFRLDPAKKGGGRVVLRGTNWAREPKETPLVCAGTGPEAVYAVTATRPGSLEVQLRAAQTRLVLHARRVCSESATQLGCSAALPTSPGEAPGLPEPLRLSLDAGETVFVFVDGPSSAYQGAFELELTLTEALCGNGRVDAGEECDDGDAEESPASSSDAGDGCSACTLEEARERDTCPGLSLAFSEDDAGLFRARHTHTTSGLVGNYQSQGPLVCATRTAPDAVYHFRAPVSGALRAELEAAFDGSLQLRALCDIEQALAAPGLSLPEIQALRAQELACQNARTGQGNELLETRVEAEHDYWILVGSPLAAQSGLYRLTLELEPDPAGVPTAERSADPRGTAKRNTTERNTAKPDAASDGAPP